MATYCSYRRPIAEQMLTITLRDVRPLVEPKQESVALPEMGQPLSLSWQYRRGGCFGPQSSAAMNQRQQIPREQRDRSASDLDRGATGGWHLLLICPVCSKHRKKLFAHSWAEKLRPDFRLWACGPCHRVTYESCNRPGSKRGPKPDSYDFRKHEEAALKIKRDFMKLNPEDEGLPANLLVLKPSPDNKMHWERWEALCQLVSAHETLALGSFANRVSALSGKAVQALSMINFNSQLDQAQKILLQNSWATRQSSWHRQGRPRPGPGERCT